MLSTLDVVEYCRLCVNVVCSVYICVVKLFCSFVFMLFFFFFFKQKTAYEMRISDWSSDVCSSDLDGGRRGRRWVLKTPVHIGCLDALLTAHPRASFVYPRREFTTVVASFCHALEASANSTLAITPHKIGEQIGRASCRERVCQYV